MSVPGQYVEELNKLNKEILSKNPDDVLQFCATYFNAKLEDQRRQLWLQQTKAQQAGITLFPAANSGSGSAEGAPRFKSPFGDSDPHLAAHDPHGPADPADPADPGAAADPVKQAQKSVFGGSKWGSDSPGGFRGEFAAQFAKRHPSINANRRTLVSAETLNPSLFANDSWKPPVRKLTPEQLARLNKSVANNFLFLQLEKESLNTVIHALEEKKVAKDTDIITQGDEGDFFYVLELGSVEFYVDGVKVAASGPGLSFGELALMYNLPRAATVHASTDCVLWALDRMTFRRILLEGTAKRRTMYEAFLQEIPVLLPLSVYERSKLADALKTELYAPGEVIVTQGDSGDAFYFIESGEVAITKDGVVVNESLGKGGYFGEVALLNDLPRQATVTAKTPVKVATLGKDGFQRLLGPAVEVLRRQDPTQH